MAAATSSLRFDRADKESPVKLDGSLREWPPRTGAKKVVSGDGSKTSFAVALQYDEGRLYVGGEVSDASFERTSRFADTEDHAVLTLAFPVGSGALAALRRSGSTPVSRGERRGRPVRVRRATRTGRSGRERSSRPHMRRRAPDTFEVGIPWSAFPEGRTTRVGLRGNLRYFDSEGAAVRAVVASGDGDAAHASTLSPLLTEPEQAIVEGLLVPKGILGATPRFDLVADVAGDGMKERITVYDQYLAICGPHYRNGNQFFFRDLGGEVVSLDAREVTGRSKDDLVLQRKVEVAGTTRQYFEVWSILGKSDEPQTSFGHEVAIVSSTNRTRPTPRTSAAKTSRSRSSPPPAGTRQPTKSRRTRT